MPKIVTWNVNSIKARMSIVVDWLQQHQPDIVLLQELKCTTESFPLEPIENLGYNCAVFGQKTYNGVAILSKSPLENIQTSLPNFEDSQSRYIEAFTEGLYIASVYVPNGQSIDSDKYIYKLKFMDALHTHLQNVRLNYERCVIGGDYNIAPNAIDMHNPTLSGQDRVLSTRAEQSALRKILNHGYLDAVRALHPNQIEIYTWWDYRASAFQQNKGYRIDHMLLTPQAADLLESIDVDCQVRGLERTSDHAPVTLHLRSFDF